MSGGSRRPLHLSQTYDDEFRVDSQTVGGTSGIALPRIARAVLDSRRREAEAVYVADGDRVREFTTALPSPLSIAQSLRAALLGGDIAAALQLIHPVRRDDFDRIYTAAGASLPSDGAGMANFRVSYIRPDEAIVRFDAPVDDDAGGTKVLRFPIHLLREEDGSWLVESY